MARKLDPNQLDVFKEAEKDDVAKKIQQEEETYQRIKSKIESDIKGTQDALRDQRPDYLTEKEWRDDLEDYSRQLKDLEESHKRTLDELYAKQRGLY